MGTLAKINDLTDSFGRLEEKVVRSNRKAKKDRLKMKLFLLLCLFAAVIYAKPTGSGFKRADVSVAKDVNAQSNHRQQLSAHDEGMNPPKLCGPPGGACSLDQLCCSGVCNPKTNVCD